MIRRKTRRVLAMMITFAIILGLAGCSAKSTDKDGKGKNAERGDVLVVGVEGSFQEKWNPFLADSHFDMHVIRQLFVPILMRNEDNELEPYGGAVESEETEDGGVLYTVTLNEGMKFTDGEEVTIDDYLWSLYVRADPSFTGLNALIQTSIEGVKEYYYDNMDYSAKVAEIEAEAEANWTKEAITFENFLVYAKETSLDGWWSGEPEGDIGDGKTTWAEYISAAGYDTELKKIDADDADALFKLLARVEYDTSLGDYDTYNWYLDTAKEKYAMENLKGGAAVKEISGIRKLDDYSCTIKYTEIDAFAQVGLFDGQNGNGNLVPSHYYGDIKKGDVSSILSNMKPLGSGAYIWDGFSDNIVTAKANKDFFLGTPKIGTVRWQYIPAAEIVTALVSGQVDIGVPNAVESNLTQLESGGVEYHLTDNAGFGYLGFSAANLPQDVRKGLASLMNRRPAVEGYFGDLATVIERPMTTTIAEYPADATEYYGYNVDKALEYFEKAGYSNVGGKLVDSSGKQLVVSAYVGGQGQGEHPAYSMLVQAAEDLASLGGEMQIQDVNFNVLQAAIDDGTADMYCLAWSASTNCDRKEQFHTNGSQNRSRISDSELDAMLDEVLRTVDFDDRCEIVSDMLDRAMELVIEMPLYQRRNVTAYNPTNLNMDTIPQANAYYDYNQVLWQVELKG